MVIVTVADGQEKIHELAVFIAHREIALMVLHRRDDGGLRQFQVIFIEFPTKGCRIFDEVDDFFQEVIVHNDGTALFVSQILQAIEDHLLADFRVDDEEMFFTRFFISCRAFDREIASAQETMAAADLARLDVGQFKGDDVFIEESDEPADRTDEVEVQAAPVHALREIEACDDTFHEVRQEAGRVSADAGDVGIDITIFDDEVLDVDFLAPGKTHGGFRRIAVGVVSDLDRRAFMFSRYVSLFFSDAFHDEGDAARRTESTDRFIGDMGFAKGFPSQLLDLGKDTRHIMSRDFFSTDFK